MKSDVFKNMFCGSIPFKDEPVLIKDIEYKVFKAMLKYIYTDEINLEKTLDLPELINLLYASKKYMITSLETKCVEYINSNIDQSNAIDVYLSTPI
ncbi:unnamed protein product, partial [Gordionus sp. m RMFG-2023]